MKINRNIFKNKTIIKYLLSCCIFSLFFSSMILNVPAKTLTPIITSNPAMVVQTMPTDDEKNIYYQSKVDTFCKLVAAGVFALGGTIIVIRQHIKDKHK